MQIARRTFTQLGSALAVALGIVGFACAHEGHVHGGAPHGGTEAKTKRHHFEVVFTKSGLTVLPHGADGSTVDVSRLAASATFYHPASSKPWFSRVLRPTAARPGPMPASLGLALDLSRVPAQDTKVSFQISGLSDPAEPTVTFTVPFARSGGGTVVVAQATQADQVAIAKLKLCPVSGEGLGSMGPTLKVSCEDRSTFLCCKGCLKQLEANPDKFLAAPAASPTPHPGHDHHSPNP